MEHISRKDFLKGSAAGALGVALTGILGASAITVSAEESSSDAKEYTQEEFDALDATTVVKSADSPTGYYVTFRYTDPDATRVRIYGEWAFTDLDHGTAVTSLNATPEEWQNGYTIWQTSGWPTADMTLNEDTGVWSYTIPLPNGTWNYRFYVGGAADAELTDYTDAQMVCDPTNPNYTYGTIAEENMTGEKYLTSVYVPYDEEKQSLSVRVEEQAPRAGENGEVIFEGITTADGLETNYGVYLPYGYDADQAEAYPVLVLFHGGGGYYGSWFNNGLAHILDNMVAEGRMEPTIVVVPDGTDFGWDRDAITDYVVNTLLPTVCENYNASTDASRRAIAGLSFGGATIMNTYFNATKEFAYYIDMSSPMMSDVYADYTKEELHDVKLMIGYGLYDFVTTKPFFDEATAAKEGSIFEYIYGLADAGVDFVVKNNLPYGHQWSLWREILVYAIDNFLWK